MYHVRNVASLAASWRGILVHAWDEDITGYEFVLTPWFHLRIVAAPQLRNSIRVEKILERIFFKEERKTLIHDLQQSLEIVGALVESLNFCRWEVLKGFLIRLRVRIRGWLLFLPAVLLRPSHCRQDAIACQFPLHNTLILFVCQHEPTLLSGSIIPHLIIHILASSPPPTYQYIQDTRFNSPIRT